VPTVENVFEWMAEGIDCQRIDRRRSVIVRQRAKVFLNREERQSWRQAHRGIENFFYHP